MKYSAISQGSISKTGNDRIRSLQEKLWLRIQKTRARQNPKDLNWIGCFRRMISMFSVEDFHFIKRHKQQKMLEMQISEFFLHTGIFSFHFGAEFTTQWSALLSQKEKFSKLKKARTVSFLQLCWQIDRFHSMCQGLYTLIQGNPECATLIYRLVLF